MTKTDKKEALNKKKKDRITKIRSLGHLGFRREGGGRVVYLFHSNVDFDAIEEITDTLYDDVIEGEDGEEQTDFSEYDPSILNTDMAGELSDELKMMEVVKKIKAILDSEIPNEHNAAYEFMME